MFWSDFYYFPAWYAGQWTKEPLPICSTTVHRTVDRAKPFTPTRGGKTAQGEGDRHSMPDNERWFFPACYAGDRTKRDRSRRS